MIRAILTTLAVALATAGAQGATLYLQFADGQTEVTLAPSSTVDVEIWIDLGDGDAIAGLLSQNEAATGLSQVSVAVQPPAWLDASSEGDLGVGAEVSIGASLQEDAVNGAGSHLLAVQTVQADASLAGSTAEITFLVDVDFPRPTLTKPDGADFRIVGPAYADMAGAVLITSGSPGYTTAYGEVSERSPLLVHVSSTDGGGTPPPDDGGDVTPPPDDSSTNGDGVTPPPDDSTTNGDVVTPPPDDSSTNGDDVTPPPDDGSGNADDGQTPPVDDGSNVDNTDGSNPEPDQPRGLCGLGTVSAMPIILGWLLLMGWRRR